MDTDKPKKGIGQAIKEADEEHTKFLMNHLGLEDYHKAVELSNRVVDLNVHAIGLLFDDYFEKNNIPKPSETKQPGHAALAAKKS